MGERPSMIFYPFLSLLLSTIIFVSETEGQEDILSPRVMPVKHNYLILLN